MPHRLTSTSTDLHSPHNGCAQNRRLSLSDPPFRLALGAPLSDLPGIPPRPDRLQLRGGTTGSCSLSPAPSATSSTCLPSCRSSTPAPPSNYPMARPTTAPVPSRHRLDEGRQARGAGLREPVRWAYPTCRRGPHWRPGGPSQVRRAGGEAQTPGFKIDICPLVHAQQVDDGFWLRLKCLGKQVASLASTDLWCRFARARSAAVGARGKVAN